jgi:phospholipase/carboxylesterase
MTWMQFSQGFQLDPIAEAPAEALVVLLHDLGSTAATLLPVAARWAATVPTTSFLALDAPSDLSRQTLDLDAKDAPTLLDRAARRLDPMLVQQLHGRRLNMRRLVLVGFGYGGTLALHMLLRHGWNCAGVLAYGAKLTRPLPSDLRADRKVRLIECEADRDIGHRCLREVVAALTACGIDARGVLLAGSVASDEAIRHGAAYLVELVATAQRGDRFHTVAE